MLTPQPMPAVLKDRKPVRGAVVWWLRILGVVAFFVILKHLPGAREVKLDHMDVRWLGVCMLLTLLQLFIDAFVWHWLMAIQRIRLSLLDTLVNYLSSQYLGLVTPGHVGEFLAAGYVTAGTGITFGYALSSVVMKKLLSWVSIIGFGVWGLQHLAEMSFLQGVKWVLVAVIVVVVVMGGGIAIWIFSLQRLARKWERLTPWLIDMTEFWSGMRALAGPQLLLPLAFAAVGFSLLFFQLDAVLHALGIALPILTVAKIMAVCRMVARIVPLSLVGLGSKDAAVITLLAQEGVDPAVGLTITLLLLTGTYLVTLLLSGLGWWIKPLVVRRAGPASS